jgi:arylsulfatase
MIRWPGRIPARKSNGMVSIHDFLPTLATIIGAQVPDDRPIDGVDQSAFFLGKSEQSARESLITFIEGQIAAVRFKQWRIYPQQFTASSGNPSAYGLSTHRVDGVGFPAIFNIERDPRELWNVVGVEGWVLGEYLRLTGEYQASLKKYPNPPGFSMTKFKK